MTSTLGFGLWIHSNRTLNSRALVFHSSPPTPSAVHLLPTSFSLCPPLLYYFNSFLHSSLLLLKPFQAIILFIFHSSVSPIIYILSSVAISLLHIHPTIHSAFLTCIDPFISPCLLSPRSTHVSPSC